MTSLLMNMNIKVTQVDEVMDIIKCSIALTDQIEMSEFVDRHGHKIEMNDAYVKLKESIHKFNELLANCNKSEFVDKRI